MGFKSLRQLEFEGQNTEKKGATKKNRSRELYEWLNIHLHTRKVKSPDGWPSSTSGEKNNYKIHKANYPRAHTEQEIL